MMIMMIAKGKIGKNKETHQIIITIIIIIIITIIVCR